VHQEPRKEIEIQDVVENLLIGRGLAKGIDYDRETGRVKLSVKESVPDFIFPRLGLALEVKLIKDRDRQREAVDEINSDIRSYGQKYGFLMFVVYDLGTIRDEAEFKHGLESADAVSVIIVKH
jgi:REase_DpnII-MboI